jgi:hypothetical protein
MCHSRLSEALNNSGIKIPFKKGVTVSGANGNWYFHSITDLQNFFKNKLSKPEEFSPSTWRSGIGKRNGILYFRVRWNDATGHVTLYRGGTGEINR